jgi:CBS domain-containing protein
MNTTHQYRRLSSAPGQQQTRSQPALTVGDLMTPEPIVISDGAPLADCIRLLEASEISGLPVVDSEGLLLGVITASDIVRAQATAYLWNRWPELRVRHLMHSPALTADRSMTMLEAAEIMEQAHVHRLVVVGDDQSTPIGLISTTDLVRALAGRWADD